MSTQKFYTFTYHVFRKSCQFHKLWNNIVAIFHELLVRFLIRVLQHFRESLQSGGNQRSGSVKSQAGNK